MKNRHKPSSARTRQLTWYSLSSVAELTAGIVCSCMPLLPAMFHHLNLRTRIVKTSRSWLRYVRKKGPSAATSSDRESGLTPKPGSGSGSGSGFKSLHLGWSKNVVFSTTEEINSDDDASGDDRKPRPPPRPRLEEWIRFDANTDLEDHTASKNEYTVPVATDVPEAGTAV